MCPDPINVYFRKFYPEDADANWEMEYCVGSYARRYRGASGKTIFPAIECADGFKLSVQGHFGAYSFPRDDFADLDGYSLVEVMSPHEPDFMVRGSQVGEEFIYGYVPVERVLAVIEKHGGCAALFSQEGSK
ncbi:hypothetical protein [Rhizobium rhizogenes]|uniref:hypothetical protein n=1 Tax=Rhizobium rhizogenes TaxID=359 RepID=UPI001573D4EF|nr:hypothetical protein [Rhizobium rhizogenes]NTG07181.1 hypothetical protein [Rhizobium rhizogenes]